MNWLHRFLSRFSFYQKFIRWSKRATLPGLQGIPLFDVSVFFMGEWKKEHINTKATSLAFRFLLALFPAIIFLFTLIPYIPIEDFQDQLLMLLSQLLPKNAQLAMKTTILEIVRKQNSGLLSVGFFTALYFSTNGVVALMNTFNKTALVPETRTFLRQRSIALMLTFFLSLLILTGIMLITGGEYLIDFLHDEKIIKGKLIYYALQSLRWFIIIALFFCTTSILYYFGPATRKRFHFFSAGSTLATILAIVTSVGFAFYINHFSRYNKIYGSIGTLIVVMLWLYINSLIILVGFELNASIHINKKLHSKKKFLLRNELKEEAS